MKELKSANDAAVRQGLTDVQQLLENGARKDAFFRLREVSDLEIEDWNLQQKIGIRYFQIGSLDRSEWAFRQCLRRNPESGIAWRFLSALLTQKGQHLEAEKCAHWSAKLDPITQPDEHSPDNPTVLRLRSIDQSYHGITWNRQLGINECGLRRGHFSTRFLLDRSKANIYTADIFGDNLPPALQAVDIDVIVNTVSCPDLKGSALVDVQGVLSKFPGIPVINDPQKVLRTTRLENAERLNGFEGVQFPKTVKFVVGDKPGISASQIFEAGFAFPVILREAGTQTGNTVYLAHDPSELERGLSQFESGCSVYAIQYVDCLGEDGYFHKMRAFFVDGTFFPVANLTSDHWEIHSGDRYRIMDKLPAAQVEERRYLAGPRRYLGDRNFHQLCEIARIVDLDFFGVDFAIDRGGNLVIFETNAAMRHNFDHADAFPYTAPHLQRVSDAFMGMMLERVAGTTQCRSGPTTKNVSVAV